MNQGLSLRSADHFRAALAIVRRHPEWGLMPPTVVLFNLGTTLFNEAYADSALIYLGEALERRPALKMPRDLLIGELHVALGTADEQLNQAETAELEYAAAVREHTERLGPDHQILIGVFSRIGALEFRRGDYARSIDYNQKVQDILRPHSGPDDVNVLLSAMAIAQALEQLGDLIQARATFERVRPKLEAGLRLAQGDRSRARTAAAEAVRTNRLAGSPDPATTLQALGTQYEAAARLAEWGEADRLDAELEAELRRCVLQSNNQTDDVWIARSRVAALRGRAADALAAAATGARAARERLARNTRGLADRQALTLSQTLSQSLDELLHIGAQADPAAPRLCWDEVIRTRGLVRAEIARRRLPAWGVEDRAFVARHAAWVAAESRLARLEMRLAGQARGDESDAQLTAARRRAREFPAALDDVARALTPGQALVAFVVARGDDDVAHLLAFVTRGDSVRGAEPAGAVQDFGSVSELTPLVTAWRAALGETRPGRRDEATCRRVGRAVRDRLWEPVAAATAGVAEIFLVPDGPVAGVPWGALPGGGRGYLVETGPTLQVLDAERELVPDSRDQPGQGLLALGGADCDLAPDFTSPGGAPVAAARLRAAPSECGAPAIPRFTPLPGTLAEVRAVEAAWSRGGAASGPVVRLEAGAATEAEFKRLAPRRNVLHLATHGIALTDGCAPTADGLRGGGRLSPLAESARPPRPSRVKRASLLPAPRPRTKTKAS